ncbi:MAG: hypothetical protein HOO96_22490 [Polyangiaceae bacterium]|nr:hypothetical protein [Polyangiaceae bacterium]
MGAFFSNVQVRADQGGFEKIVAALRADAASREMSEVDEAGDPDRVLLIAPPGPGGFVSVYDEATESQDARALDALGALVSRAAEGSAFTVLVHDSDVLALTLFSSGDVIDRYDSNPGYFGKKRKKRVERRVDAWAPLLRSGVAAVDLHAVLAAEDLFAEATLVKVCELVGCDPLRASTGQKYLSRDPSPLPDGTVTLRLRSMARPAYETPPEGAPRFEPHMPYGPTTQALAEGDQLRLGFAVKNAGGASRGLTITVWGSAIDAGLVEVERFETVFGNVLEGARHAVHSPERLRSASGDSLFVLHLPQQELVAGAPMTSFAPGMDARKMMSASMRSRVHVNVTGRVVQAGKGTLFGGFVPHAAREDGAHAGQYDLTVDPRLARPLRFPVDEAMHGGSSHLLRPLAATKYLVAMASIDGPRADAARFAAQALERMLEIQGTSGNAATTVYRKRGEEGMRRPRSGAGKVTTLLRGKRRDTLTAAMGEEALVDVTVREGPAFDPETGPNLGLWGLSFGASVLGDRDDARVGALTVWLDADAAGEARTSEVRTMLLGLLDEIMRGDGVQASLFRCGATAPAYSSAYEDACGAPHDVRTGRSYVRRWLRVPGNDTLWLGPSLLAHLPAAATSALEAIATVAPCGSATRIGLSDAKHVPLLEEALAPLLPTVEEARAAAMELIAHT